MATDDHVVPVRMSGIELRRLDRLVHLARAKNPKHWATRSSIIRDLIAEAEEKAK